MTHIAVAKNRNGNFSSNSGVVSHEQALNWAQAQFTNNTQISQVLICEITECVEPVKPAITVRDYVPPIHLNGGKGATTETAEERLPRDF